MSNEHYVTIKVTSINELLLTKSLTLVVAPFNDEALYIEQYNKANFWYQTCFHNVDLSSLREAAMKEYFRQPIVDTFDIRICQAKSIRHSVDFLQAAEEDLHVIGE